MRGSRAKYVRKLLDYEKSPLDLQERGGLFEKDGDARVWFKRASNPKANFYRNFKSWATTEWKRTSGPVIRTGSMGNVRKTD